MTANAKAHSAFFATRSRTSFNDSVSIQTMHLAPFYEDSITIEIEPLETVLPQASPRRKIGIKKKLTPKKLQVAAASPSNPASPASNTRSKKKLQLQ